ncbi:MAG: hypothetical protein JNL02_20535 [Saprospiraceae bacterium]|nr:hypothetical protein [Saprospiraceae bacterium]
MLFDPVLLSGNLRFAAMRRKTPPTQAYIRDAAMRQGKGIDLYGSYLPVSHRMQLLELPHGGITYVTPGLW